jgi:hypothetical protein
MDWLDDNGVHYTQVESSNVHSVGYKVSTHTLFVKFLDKKTGDWGSIYAYKDVPSHLYLGLLAAHSKGEYLGREIKGKYQYRQVA